MARPDSIRHVSSADKTTAPALSRRRERGLRLLLVLLGAYAAGLVAGALSVCGRSGNFSYLPIMPIIFAIFHLGYGCGFLKGINDSLLRRNSGKAFITMTR